MVTTVKTSSLTKTTNPKCGPRIGLAGRSKQIDS